MYSGVVAVFFMPIGWKGRCFVWSIFMKIGSYWETKNPWVQWRNDAFQWIQCMRWNEAKRNFKWNKIAIEWNKMKQRDIAYIEMKCDGWKRYYGLWDECHSQWHGPLTFCYTSLVCRSYMSGEKKGSGTFFLVMRGSLHYPVIRNVLHVYIYCIRIVSQNKPPKKGSTAWFTWISSHQKGGPEPAGSNQPRDGCLGMSGSGIPILDHQANVVKSLCCEPESALALHCQEKTGVCLSRKY